MGGNIKGRPRSNDTIRSLPLIKDGYFFVLVFGLLLSFSIHNFNTIGQDIGRHLKLGEIIWQTKQVPKTNLFSFTEPDFPFINHHWLSEVLFFAVFSYFGFRGLILGKALLALAAFGFPFFAVRSRAKFWPLAISFLLSIFIFIERTEVRPEIFSFAMLSLFLFVLLKAKYSSGNRVCRWLYLLPFLELLWVNLHIYFFIGPFLVSAFLIDRLLGADRAQVKTTLTVLCLTIAATLINPNGLQGALLPFRVLNEYGYSIVENQPLSFLANFYNFNLSIFVFKTSVAVLIASALLIVKDSKSKIFELTISAFFIYLGFRMLRNLPLYAVASFPVSALFLTHSAESFGARFRRNSRAIHSVFRISISVTVVLLIFLVANNSFYKYIQSPKIFGLAVPNGLERAVDFLKEHKIRGPIFNNFDLGGYLIWQLYPEERVFVDNRPEAYPAKFFNEVYKPMQEEDSKWMDLSNKYDINVVFFGHTDATPWGNRFLGNIAKNPDWKVIYINEEAVILVRNSEQNSELISRFAVTDTNFAERVSGYIQQSNADAIDLNLNFSRAFYNLNALPAAAYFAEETLKLSPDNSRAYLYKGLVHAYYTDQQNQELAAEDLRKAIDLGLKDDYYYTILGVVYINLDRGAEAKRWFLKALDLNKNNAQAREFLATIS